MIKPMKNQLNESFHSFSVFYFILLNARTVDHTHLDI